MQKERHTITGYLIATLAACTMLAGCATNSDTGVDTAASDGAEKTATILAMNDIYRIAGIRRGVLGGMARVTKFRQELEASGHDVLVLHAGDFLSPSLLGNTYKGAQMVDLMNRMDGTDGFDDRLIVTIGNHEFDNAKCEAPYSFLARVAESDFYWLQGNFDFTACDDAVGPGFKSINDASNVVKGRLVTLGGIRFGIFGLTLPEGNYARLVTAANDLNGYIAMAKAMTSKLRDDGAEQVIALTHLDIGDDEAILKALGDDGPDLIVGGHDHEQMAVSTDNGRSVYKQTADALDVGIHTFKRAGGAIEHTYRTEQMDGALDPAAKARVQWWLDVHEAGFCTAANKSFGCLKDPMGTTATEWKLEENANRKQETAIGNWLADQMIAFKRKDVDACENAPAVGLLGSGSLRLNYNVSPGFALQRREVEELFPYDMKLFAICTDGKALYAALENGLSKPGAGRHPHISGMEVVYSREDRRNAPALVQSVTTTGGQAIARSEEQKVIVVTGDYIVKGNDGYTMWPKDTAGKCAPCTPILTAPDNEKSGQADLKVWTLETFEKAGSANAGAIVGPTKPLDGETCRLTNKKVPGEAACTPKS